MSDILPIGIDDLLSGCVESARLECKASWDPDYTGAQVLETLCAFANDLQNLNGGYVVLGIATADGVVRRPAKGLLPEEVDGIQRWIRGQCKRLEPNYLPVMAPCQVDGQTVLVLWAPASDIRPHQAPAARTGERTYFVRLGSETVRAKDEILTRLMQQTSRVPFDDRGATDARVEDLRESRVREFLRDVHSDLLGNPDSPAVYRAMQITRRTNGHEVPRNIALLFFTEEPERWFRGARIEVVQFGDDAGGNTIEERTFRGPIHEQIRQSLTWLTNHGALHIEKKQDRAEARTFASYPLLALREALVNAVYHRSYEHGVEPTKVYLYPDRIEIISYPGPVDGIEASHFVSLAPLPPVPARNRRVGELLKELRLAEGRGTGLPKIYRTMRENGSPEPRFDFDAARSFFRVTLPAHP